MEEYNDDRWLTRQELAKRFALPVKTLAQWASHGAGPRYARMGRHVRYRLSDVVDWEASRFDNTHTDTTRHDSLTNADIQGHSASTRSPGTPFDCIETHRDPHHL